MLSSNEVLNQSKAAYRQWEDKWKYHAKINGEIYEKNGNKLQDLLCYGTGKICVICAMGNSFEKKIKLLKKYRENFDIICCDKNLKYLIKYDIIPDFVVLADAGINYEEWCESVLEYTKDIILITNVTANVKWTKNWKGKIYFHLNKDNIQSELVFAEISGCREAIPAASCVGNSAVVFATQILRYDEYYLLGYDYGWADDEGYYAFFDNNKRYWMNHAHTITKYGQLLNESQNLIFSARWLMDFYTVECAPKNIKLYNGYAGGILENIEYANLEKSISQKYERKITQEEKSYIMNIRAKEAIIKADENLINNFNSFIQDKMISCIKVQFLDRGETEWIASK